jgi:2-iminobutanoate/2-iminopropanoate deaminase
MMQRHDPPGVPAPIGGYTHGLELPPGKQLLFISGQVPLRLDGSVPKDFDAQCHLVWDHIFAVLAEAGLKVRDLVKVTTYLSDRAYAEANGKIRRERLGSHSPALTVVIAGIYDPAWLLEIEAIAAS